MPHGENHKKPYNMRQKKAEKFLVENIFIYLQIYIQYITQRSHISRKIKMTSPLLAHYPLDGAQCVLIKKLIKLNNN